MENNIQHIGSLIGRIFLIAQPFATKEWGGSQEKSDGETDYDLLDGFISYEEGDLTLFEKSVDVNYFIFFSMSTKIEVFKKENGFVLCDGLYFNKSWNFSNEIVFKVVEEMKFQMNITDKAVTVFDAAIEGDKVLLNEGKSTNSSVFIDLSNGVYKIKKVETSIMLDEQEVLLKGIEVSC
jgi:hypothetical protein